MHKDDNQLATRVLGGVFSLSKSQTTDNPLRTRVISPPNTSCSHGPDRGACVSTMRRQDTTGTHYFEEERNQ